MTAIEAVGISKRYGAVTALNEASFAALPGEIHALVGENGAGKSTLIKVLCGLTQPDSGSIRVAGETVRLGDTQAAQRLGIWTVFQELTLLPWLTVAENLLIGREPRGRLGLIRRRDLPGKAAELLAAYNVTSISPHAVVADLSLAQRQVVEIVRAVSHRPRVLFLDEPTSSLGEHEVEWLFDLVRTLRDAGTCTVFTSHRWREVASLADRITVLRNGAQVATRESLEEAEAIRLMTGRSLSEIEVEVPALDEPRPLLEVSELRGGRLEGVSFTLRQGEILGIGGLEGHGQRELFLSLFGAGNAHGEITIDGEAVTPHGPGDAIRAGIALVPEDRKGEGLFLPMSVRENLTLPIIGTLAAGGLLTSRAEEERVRGVVERMGVRARDAEQEVRALSGGNQQKVLIGRWLLTDARVLLLYDVTRGVDVATKQEIYRLVAELAGEGRSILYYSSDTEEIARLAHRVLVLREGKVAAEIPGPDIDPEAIVSAAVREDAA